MEQNNFHKGHRARLKEEFRTRGVEGWPEHKVLELLLIYAIPQGDVNPLAHRLIDRFVDLSGVLDAPVEELKAVSGMGEHTAILMKLIPALCGRYLAETGGARPEETASRALDYAGQLYPYFIGAIRERFCLISLDSRRKVLGVDLIAEGEVNSVRFQPRQVVAKALSHNAVGVVLAHNHVGAYATPSIADLTMTQELKRLLSQVGVDLLDHLIFSGEDYVSLRESGSMAGL